MKVKAIALATIVSPMIGFGQNINAIVRPFNLNPKSDKVIDDLGKCFSELKVKRLNEVSQSNLRLSNDLNKAYKVRSHFQMEIREYLAKDYDELMLAADEQNCKLSDIQWIGEAADLDLTELVIEGHTCASNIVEENELIVN